MARERLLVMKVRLVHDPAYPHIHKTPGGVVEAKPSRFSGLVEVPVPQCRDLQRWSIVIGSRVKHTVTLDERDFETPWKCSCGSFVRDGSWKYACSHLKAARKVWKETACRWNEEYDPSAQPAEGDACPLCGAPVTRDARLTLYSGMFEVVEETEAEKAEAARIHEEQHGVVTPWGTLKDALLTRSKLRAKYDGLFEWWAHDCYGLVWKERGATQWGLSVTVSPMGTVERCGLTGFDTMRWDTRDEVLAWVVGQLSKS